MDIGIFYIIEDDIPKSYIAGFIGFTLLPEC